MPQFLSGVEWWVPIPWLLAVIGIAIAVLNFRRSRHPAMRILRMRVDWIAKPGEPDYHAYFHLELLSIGTDIFDLEVYLESVRRNWVRSSSFWLPWRYCRTVERQEFKPYSHKAFHLPLDESPNPIKNGQVVCLKLDDKFMCGWCTDGHGGDLYRCPSELWPWRVRIAVRHSGRRLLLSRSSWRFRRLLRSFDSQARDLREKRLTLRSSGPPSASGQLKRYA